MSVLESRSLALALVGASLLHVPRVGAQVSGDAIAPGAEPAAASARPAGTLSAPRSGLWQTIEAEYRRPPEAVDPNPHRLSEAQRQELRDQIRRASLRADSPPMAPVVSRP